MLPSQPLVVAMAVVDELQEQLLKREEQLSLLLGYLMTKVESLSMRETMVETVDRAVGATHATVDVERARVEADAQKWREKLKIQGTMVEANIDIDKQL
jgi:hypothetical protein